MAVPTYIVDEPEEADNKQAEAIEAQNQLVWRFSILHGVSLEFLGFFEEETDDEEGQGKDNANSE